RVTFPLFFAPEILTGVVVPLLLALIAAASAGVSLPTTALCVLAIAYVPECMLAWSKGWHLSPRSVTAMIVRDAMLPAIWARGWLGG
ncbi:MAG: ceramide glucosyltransferase, partial [Mesorhizobium sp.]